MDARTVRRVTGSCLVMVTFAIVSLAQGNQGTIEGLLADQSGARISGAKLTATNASTGARYTAESNQEGLYRFLLLPTGTYDLDIRKSGFAYALQKGVQITVGAKVDLDFTLRIAVSPNSVDVTDEVPTLETNRTPVRFTVDKASVANLATNGRNFMDFVLLVPGVTRDVRTGELSFGGQRGMLNSLTVDGFDNNNTFFGETTGGAGTGRAPYQFSLDSVQEFQVNSNSFSAELGRAAAVVNVVTKSGSNRLHGTGFWFYRDRGLTAFDPIVKLDDAISGTSTPKPGYHLNQFGGNIGGPIRKNRIFFFFNYEGQRNAQTNDVDLVIPSGNPTIFQQMAIRYLQAQAAPWKSGLNQNTYLTKGDWNISGHHSLSIRWNRQQFNGPGIENGGSVISFGDSGTSIVNTDAIGASLTSVLSPNIVNVARFGYLIDHEAGRPNSDLPRAIVSEGGQTLLDLGRVSFDPRETTIHRQQYADTLTYSHGRHIWKFGADFIHDDILNFFPGNFSGGYSFNSLENFGRSLAGMPLIAVPPGAPGDSFTQAFAGPETPGATTYPNVFEASWFVQDDWQLRHNLTLYPGIRWDLQKSAKPTIDNPVAGAAGIHTNQLNTDLTDFGPRFGFAWVPFAKSPTVLRGGYGIFYGYTPSIMLSTADSNNGVSIVTKTFADSAIPSYPNTLCGVPVGTPNCPPPSTGSSSPPSIYVFATNYRQPVVQEANLNLEHSLTRDLSLSVGWQMVKGNHLLRVRDINLGTATLATVTLSTTGQLVDYSRYPSVRPIPEFTRISQFESSANSLYHGLFLQLRKRMSQRFEGTVSYTFSHVIDDAPDINALVPFSPTDDSVLLSDPKHPRADRSGGLDDQRHRLVLSGIWQLNYADTLSRWVRAIFGGWQTSIILSAQSGKPYTGLVNADLNNDSNQYTDRIPTEGKNGFNLPATWTLDPRLSKFLNLREQTKLELLIEAFNVFNHFNVPAVNNIQYHLVGNTLVPADVFGRPTSPGVGSNYPFASPQNLNGARILQLGAKISF